MGERTWVGTGLAEYYSVSGRTYGRPVNGHLQFLKVLVPAASSARLLNSRPNSPLALSGAESSAAEMTAICHSLGDERVGQLGKPVLLTAVTVLVLDLASPLPHQLQLLRSSLLQGDPGDLLHGVTDSLLHLRPPPRLHLTPAKPGCTSEAHGW